MAEVPDDATQAPRAPRRVGLLHPGQMGAAVAAAVRADAGVELCWCPEGRSAATARRADAAGLVRVDTLRELLATSEVVLSICPPAAAADLAAEVAGTGFTGLYADLNAVSTRRLAGIAEQVTGAGARVVDGSIIGPPPAPGHPARLYLSGAAPDMRAVAALFGPEPLQVVELSERLGSASALKMAFGGYQKATRALAAVAHALAAEHGVGQALLAEGTLMAGAPLAELDYVPSVAARAWRWAPEMVEVADEMALAGLPTELARGAAAVLGRWAADRDRWDIDVDEALRHLRDGSDLGT